MRATRVLALLAVAAAFPSSCLLSPDASLYRNRGDAAPDGRTGKDSAVSPSDAGARDAAARDVLGGNDGAALADLVHKGDTPASADGTAPQCSDGADNDGDGDTDFPDDPDCGSALDDTEGDCIFESVESPTSTELRAVWGRSADDVIAVGKEGVIAIYSGGMWGAFTQPGKPVLNAVAGTPSGGVWAVGDDGMILRQGSVSWEIEGSGTSARLRGIWASPASGSAWAVGDEGTVLERTPAGEWQKVTPRPTSLDLRAVWGSDDDDIWAAGKEGVILHKDSSSWRVVQQDEALGEISSVTGLASDKVWLASNKGLLRQQGGGWLTTPLGGLGGNIEVSQLWADGAARLWIVGAVSGAGPQPTLLSLVDQRWSETRFAAGSTPAIRAIWSGSGCAVWAVGQNGLILRGSRP